MVDYVTDDERGFKECYDDLVKCRREVKRLREAWSAAIEIDDCLRAGGDCEPGRFFDAIVLCFVSTAQTSKGASNDCYVTCHISVRADYLHSCA